LLDVPQELQRLIDDWCDRREYRALSIVLPAWLANDGLTDGWAEVAAAVRSAYALARGLPDDERELLKQLWVQLDSAVRRG
jgi:hypothetical protein